MLTAIKLTVSAFWACLMFAVVLASAPPSPALVSAYQRKVARVLLPEGWAFFTKDAQEADLFVYRELPDGSLSPVDFREVRANPLAALSRANRIRYGELKAAVDQIAAEDWTHCSSQLERCVQSSGAEPLQLPAATYLDLCGAYTLERRKPTPWMWFRSEPELKLPSDHVRVIWPC
jgi:antimicrobial peptide system SdpA family protein